MRDFTESHFWKIPVRWFCAKSQAGPVKAAPPCVRFREMQSAQEWEEGERTTVVWKNGQLLSLVEPDRKMFGSRSWRGDRA